jgi:hypothetical protein
MNLQEAIFKLVSLEEEQRADILRLDEALTAIVTAEAEAAATREMLDAIEAATIPAAEGKNETERKARLLVLLGENQGYIEQQRELKTRQRTVAAYRISVQVIEARLKLRPPLLAAYAQVVTAIGGSKAP